MTMLVLYHPILLRRVNPRMLKDNPVFFKEGLERKKFSSIVTTKSFDM
jgi:hypothetical protein